jgi:hypothetical protein
LIFTGPSLRFAGRTAHDEATGRTPAESDAVDLTLVARALATERLLSAHQSRCRYRRGRQCAQQHRPACHALAALGVAISSGTRHRCRRDSRRDSDLPSENVVAVTIVAVPTSRSHCLRLLLDGPPTAALSVGPMRSSFVRLPLRMASLSASLRNGASRTRSTVTGQLKGTSVP